MANGWQLEFRKCQRDTYHIGTGFKLAESVKHLLIRKSFILMAGQMLKPSKKEMLRELFGFAKKRGFIVK